MGAAVTTASTRCAVVSAAVAVRFTAAADAFRLLRMAPCLEATSSTVKFANAVDMACVTADALTALTFMNASEITRGADMMMPVQAVSPELFSTETSEAQLVAVMLDANAEAALADAVVMLNATETPELV